MDELENIADIKFIEVYHKPFHNYLEIMVDEGCFSGIGSDHPQTVSLGNGCLYPEIIPHELMHALGFIDPKKYTIVPLLNGVYWEYIGNAKTLSILDREALQRAYGKAKLR